MNSIQQIEEVYAGSIYESWTNAFANLRSFIVAYNEPIQKAREAVREAEKAGREAEMPPEAHSRTIKSSVARTAEHMLRLYLHQLSELNRLDGLSIQDLPPLRTNTAALASLCNCTDRTIQNHREFLQRPDIGLISHEECHGKYGLRIWLNPKLFLKEEVRKLWKSEKNTQKDPSKNPISARISALNSTRTKILHPLGHVPQDLLDNTSSVDKASVPDGVSEAEPSDGQEPLTGTKGQGSKDQPETPKETSEKTGEKEKKDGAGGAAGARELRDPWAKFCFHYIAEFWIHAKHMLYPGVKFVESEDLAIMRHICKNLFFGMPRSISETQLKRMMEEGKWRLEAARIWLNSDRGRGFQVLDPYKYFSSTPGKGTFHQTASWYETHMKQERWSKIKQEARKYRDGKFFLTRKGEKYRPTAHQMYARHIDHLERYGDRELLDRLHSMVANSPGFYRGYKKTDYSPLKINKRSDN